ncbi:unnamed protein product [Orchesella dallaii]|uniref:Uncharacterized protein n=1 Tax=Orchesella dallaii TaxID=48710 RepID=A0ABP1S1K1_9HEXA
MEGLNPYPPSNCSAQHSRDIKINKILNMSAQPENSVLTPLVIAAVTLNKHAFFYLYPHLFEHNIDKIFSVFKITQRQWSWKLIPFFLSIIVVTTIMGLGSAYYVCITHFLGLRLPRHRLELTALLQMEFVTALGTLEVISLFALMKVPLIISCFNEIFLLEKRCNALFKYDRRSQSTSKTDWIGLCLILAIIASAASGPFVVLIGLYVQADPFHYIGEEILPDAYYRSMETIAATLIVRYILCFFCAMEFIRVGIHGTFFALLSVSALHSLLRNLPKIASNFHSFRIYLQMRVFFTVASHLINNVALLAVFVGHFMTILVLWATIMLLGELNPLISLAFLIISIFFLGLTLVLLTAAAMITSKTKDFLKQKRRTNPRLKYHHSIRFMCGPFFEFRQGTIMTYFNHIANNLTNAVILVHH